MTYIIRRRSTGGNGQYISPLRKRMDLLIINQIYCHHKRYLGRKLAEYLAPLVHLMFKKQVTITLFMLFILTFILTIYDSMINFQSYFDKSIRAAVHMKMCHYCPHSMDSECHKQVTNMLKNDTDFFDVTKRQYMLSIFTLVLLTIAVSVIVALFSMLIIILCIPTLREHILTLLALKIYLTRYKHYRFVISETKPITTELECSICFSDITQTPYDKTWCEHTFHHECLTRWRKFHSICPYCRSPILF